MRRMLKTVLLVAGVAVSLGAGAAVKADGAGGDDQNTKSADSGQSLYSVVRETSLGGIIAEQGTWLVLDEPIHFAKGSRSERVVERIRLSVPPELRERVAAMDGRHAVLEGTMECAMLFTPWSATCVLRVKRAETDR
ncbi:hypothetical protein [Pelobacter propionicus]|uniref:Uncharacterized protein n=1 Tax=Pelobacter propionicus (strain DSM 2379 / NBRC 103807 / OttBd1) TaxID=338966 RepID=A1ARA3_PELPD|nr:hypothetical protein [Pelobacter propionicus]ABK99873.1 hypothetical protein Ppro_2266 [Pelobacter propionicus DSM 2379]